MLPFWRLPVRVYFLPDSPPRDLTEIAVAIPQKGSSLELDKRHL
jgi:hypothetical protein